MKAMVMVMTVMNLIKPINNTSYNNNVSNNNFNKPCGGSSITSDVKQLSICRTVLINLASLPFDFFIGYLWFLSDS